MTNYKYYTNNSIKATTGLVAAYNMIPISGQKIVDISGNGNDASRNGTPLSTKEGVKFSGANDEYYGASSISPSFDGGKQVSIAVRFKPDNVSGTNKYIVSIPESTVGNNGINIRQNNDAIITDLLQNGSGDSVEATAVLTTNKWYTAILTFDGSTQKLYVNGSLADSSDTAYALEAASDEINIGDFGTFDGAFEGEISDVRIYNRALSEQEVKDYHNSF
ncbi:MAG TPA: LamG domain-containing protein, partial [Halanaerobiales bacterium]|nr:LamG domain-containing protein [Halanaerobiales bacterium]